MARLLSAWLPVVLWMSVLFTASTELGASRQTSRFLGPLVRWCLPNSTPTTQERIQWGIRKAGHAVGYAVLAGLLLRASRRSGRAETPAEYRHAVAWAFLLTVAFAASDEWHQTFNASRQGSLADVVLDAAGAGAGLAGLALWRWWRA